MWGGLLFWEGLGIHATVNVIVVVFSYFAKLNKLRMCRVKNQIPELACAPVANVCTLATYLLTSCCCIYRFQNVLKIDSP